MAKINSGTYTAISTIDINNDPMVIVDADDTTEDASGTTHTISLFALENALAETTLANIKANGVQSVGSTGLIPDSDHVHPSVAATPADNGLLAYNGPLSAVNGGAIAIASSLYLFKIIIRQAFTATNLWLQISTAGSGASTTSFCGIWSSAGTLLTGSADIGSSFNSGSGRAQSVAWTTPQNLTTSMGFVWVGFVFNLGSTQPTLRTLSSSSAVPLNTNLATASLAACVNGTAVTSLANITPSSNSVTAALPYWVGVS